MIERLRDVFAGTNRRTATGVGLAALAFVATIVLWRFPIQGQAYLAVDALRLFVPYRTGPTPVPRNLLDTDAAFQVYPFAALVSRSLRTDRPVPRWIPELGTGEPAVGSLPLDYPPWRWAFAWLPPWLAHNALTLLHLYLALSGTFLLARVRGASIGGALTAAAVLGLSGGLSVWLEFEPWAMAISWLPWSVLGVELALRSDLRWFALSAVALGAAALGGFLPVTELSFGLTGAYALLASTRPLRRRLGVALLSVVFGLGLGSLRLSPAFLAMSESHRTRIPFERYFAETASLNFRRLALSVAPDLLGDPAIRSGTIRELRLGRALRDQVEGEEYANPQEVRFSPGIVALALALAGASRRRNLGLALLALGILLVPFRTPLAWIAWRFVPGFGTTAPTRILAVLPLVLALLAAEGWAELCAGSTRVRNAIVAILMCLVAFAVARVNPDTGLLARPLFKPTLLAIAATAIVLRAMRASNGPSASARRWPKWARGGLLALVVLDLVEATVHYNPYGPPELLEPPPTAIARMREVEGSGRFLADRMPPDVLMHYGLKNVGTYSSLHPARFVRLVTALESGRTGRRSTFPHFLLAARIPPRWRDALDVRAVLVDPSVGPGIYQGLIEVESGGLAGSLYRNPTAVSRARLFGAGAATVCRNEDEALDVATAESFDPLSHIVIECADELPLSTVAASNVAERVLGATEIVRDDPEEVRVLVRGATAPCYLLLADAFAAGWTATLDGQPAEILPADVAFRAVVVPAGSHAVEFRYSAPGRAAAVWVTSLTVLALLAFVGLAARPTAREEAP